MNALLRALLLLVSAGLSLNAWGVCTSLIKGSVAVDVRQCSDIHPESAFPAQDSKYSFIYDLPPANRKTLYDSYRGILIGGRIVRSQAVRSGLSEEKGALSGESVHIFMPAGSATCTQVSGQRIQGNLEQICCEGGGNSPCLLDTDYVMKGFQPVERAPQKSLAQARSPEAKALYLDASKKLQAQDKKGAAAVFEKLRSMGQLDIQGQYVLALTYRDLDKCKNAMPLLAELQKQFEGNDYWVEAEPYLRAGSFLYARCLSKDGRASEAVLVLQGFLVEPKKYKKEILQSLSNPDFGYITTSKPYIKYKESAQRVLKQ